MVGYIVDMKLQVQRINGCSIELEATWANKVYTND